MPSSEQPAAVVQRYAEHVELERRSRRRTHDFEATLTHGVENGDILLGDLDQVVQRQGYGGDLDAYAFLCGRRAPP